MYNTDSSPDPDSRSRNPNQSLSSGDNSILGGEVSGDRRVSQLNGALPHYNHVRNPNNFTSNSDNG